MATPTSSKSYTTLANQAFTGAATATDEATRNALLAMGKRYEAQAAQRRTEEAAEDTERRAFWATRRPLNWVS
jgi:hypothetical protein